MLTLIAGAALKGTLVIAGAFLVNRTVLRSRSAASRHAVWSGALAAQLILLAVAPAIPAWRVGAFDRPSWMVPTSLDPASLVAADFAGLPVAPAASSARRPNSGAGAADAAAPVGAGRVESGRAAAAPAPGTTGAASQGVRFRLTAIELRRPRASLVLAAVWLFGMLLIVMRYAHGTARVARLARTSERVEDGGWLSLAQRTANRLGIMRPLTLLRGNRLGVPVTWGVVYPVVLLPAEANEWPEARRAFVLLHEMAHVKRLDALTQVMTQLTQALFWFNPLVWYAAQQARLERERACDDYVLLNGTRASFYADELLGMVRRIGAPSDDAAAPAFAALAMARRSEFEGRMLAILDPAVDRRGLGRLASLGTVVAAVALALPLAALQPFVDTPEAAAATIGRGSVVSVPRGATAGGSARLSATGVVASADAAAHQVSAFLRAAAAASSSEPVGVRSLRVTADSVSFDLGSRRVQTVAVSCEGFDVGQPASTGRHVTAIEDDDGSRFTQYMLRRKGRCVQGTILGAVAFTYDEATVAALPRGARFNLHEVTPTGEQDITFIPGRDGRIVREYRVDGRAAAFDAAAAAWLRSAIPEVLRETGLDARARVTRLRSTSLRTVLDEIARMQTAGGKRAYYEVLLDTPLNASDRSRVLTHARRQLEASPSDLDAVLARARTRPRPATRQERASAESRAGLFDEMASRMSETDRQHFIREQLPTTDRQLLLAIITRIAEVKSDGDKTSLLRVAMPHYMTSDDALRHAWFAAAETIGSSGDLSALLRVLVPVALATCEEAMVETIRTAGHVSSDGDRASLLMFMADRQMLATRATREAYAEAARTIRSDGDYTAAMSRLLRKN